MASLSSSKRRAPPPQIDVRAPRDGDNDGDGNGDHDDDDNGEGGGLRPTRTVATTKARPGIFSLPGQGTTSVPVAASRTTQEQASALSPITTVTAPAQTTTTTVTMFVTVSANPVTVTVTATLSSRSSAIPATETSAATTSNRVDTLAPVINTTGPSPAPAVMTTDSAQRNNAISGPGGAFIGGVGVAAGLSVLGMVAIIVLHRKRQKKEQQEKQPSGFF